MGTYSREDCIRLGIDFYPESYYISQQAKADLEFKKQKFSLKGNQKRIPLRENFAYIAKTIKQNSTYQEFEKQFLIQLKISNIDVKFSKISLKKFWDISRNNNSKTFGHD